MKTKKSIYNRAEKLVQQMTTDEKLNIIVETSEPIERLGIPGYYHGNEALHGVVRPGHFTVFPQAIALGAMFDDEFLEKIADAISTEARARYHNGPSETDRDEFYGRYNGLLTFWSPDLNLARDPRWGRTAETYGEDPYLAGKNGAAFVRGLQGYDQNYLKAISTPKHFTANNEEHNRFHCNAVIKEKTLREYYLEPFRMAVQEGDCEAIMGAYNAINGIPCHENRQLLHDILREEWGFDGYVVSDCSAIARIWDNHKRYDDPADAASAALNAGVDLECGGYSDYEHMFKTFLGEQLRKGKITEERLNEAARRVLIARIKAGQLDDINKLPWSDLSNDIIGCEKHKELAREAAVKSAVLLKNNGILPLDKNKNYVVVGNNADCVQFGDYSGKPVNIPVTPFEGIKNLAGENVKLIQWQYSEDTSSYQIIPKDCLYTDNSPGITGAYYENALFCGTPKTRTDEQIDFTWDSQAPDPFIATTEFSVIWRGYINPPYSGEYSFNVKYSGSAKCCPPELIIDGEIIEAEQNVFLNADKPVSFLLRYIKNQSDPSVRLLWKKPANDSAHFTREINAAKNADAVIAVIGLGTQYEMEGKDKTDISLPKEQINLLKAIKNVNDKIIVVLENGSALAIPWIEENAAAILEIWYPGEQGGNALADILFGKASPSGRLPITFPVKTEDLPSFDDYELSNGRTYMYEKTAPLFPFGFGLSYTTFSYSGIHTDINEAYVYVENTGKMEADEVVQLYIDSGGLPEQPRWRLKGFKRIHLKPGERKKVSFALTEESFSLFDESGTRRVFPGEYTVYIDGHQPDAESLKQQVFIKQTSYNYAIDKI